MSNIVPAAKGGLTTSQAIQVGRVQRKAELTVLRHGLQAAVATEIDRLDSHAIADVITTATEEELRFLDYGLALADGSAAKAELVVRKVQLLSQINNSRIARRFGR
jgi:hypothetical protein